MSVTQPPPDLVAAIAEWHGDDLTSPLQESTGICGRGHITFCEECLDNRRAAHYRRAVIDFGRQLRAAAEGQNYMWRPATKWSRGSKLHLISCQIAQQWLNPTVGEHDHQAYSHAPRIDEFRFAVHYPGGIPFCQYCERTLA